MQRNGILYVISAPSGAGKSTLCRELLDIFPELRQSVSFTTRKPRPGEVDGRDYFFVSREDFLLMVAEGGFAEWAEVHGNLYGTAIRTVRECLATGADLLLEIDCQGAAQLKDKQVAGINIFILPPSFSELRRRLEGRNADSAEVIETRIDNAAAEIREAGWYDYLVINDIFSRAVENLKAIIVAERHRAERVVDSLPDEFKSVIVKSSPQV